MNQQQPEALRLANELESYIGRPVCTEAAAELRRLHMTNVRKAMEQEPVAWLVTYGGLTYVEYTQPNMVVDTHYQPLYAAPPRREWVGLTEEEKHDCYLKIDVWSRCVEAVEAKLKEKNGG